MADEPYLKMALPAGFGINLFGQFTSNTGLGMSARHTARAVARAGVPLACFDLQSYYPMPDISDELEGIEILATTATQKLRLPINVYCTAAAMLPKLIQQIPAVFRSNRFHAGLVSWETTQLHGSWADALMRLDAIVTYSEFQTNALANLLPLTPVLTGKQPLFLDSDIRAVRADFGLPTDATIFLNSFDPSSDPLRKNPLATITAFRHAFAGNESDVRLLFRLNNAESTHMARETQRLLLEAAGGDKRIGFVLQPMSYRKVLSLYASADAYISLHRSEGLGLGMLEAMRLGVPVIATGWSGNMTFMDHRSACLVRYRLVPVHGNRRFYQPDVLGPNAVWAEPVVKDAIAWMRYLYRQPDERRRLGKTGQLNVAQYQDEALKLAWLSELARLWQTGTLLPDVVEKFSAMARKAHFG